MLMLLRGRVPTHTCSWMSRKTIDSVAVFASLKDTLSASSAMFETDGDIREYTGSHFDT